MKLKLNKIYIFWDEYYISIDTDIIHWNIGIKNYYVSKYVCYLINDKEFRHDGEGPIPKNSKFIEIKEYFKNPPNELKEYKKEIYHLLNLFCEKFKVEGRKIKLLKLK